MEFIQWIQSFSTPILDRLFIGITMLGEDYIFILITTFVFWCLDKKFGYRLGFAYLTAGVLNETIKEIFKVARPIGAPEIRSLRLETADGYSFPSGHTECAASIFTSLMIRIRKKWFYLVGSLLIILVGLSRLYLGVHWPTDVIAGAFIGILWVFFSNWLFDYAEASGRKSILLLVIIPTVIGVVLFPTPDYLKAAGASLAFFCGYLIEPRYLDYQVQAPWGKQVLKYLVGLGVLLGIQVYVKELLPEIPYSNLIRYFLMGIWVTVLAPWVFKGFIAIDANLVIYKNIKK